MVESILADVLANPGHWLAYMLAVCAIVVAVALKGISRKSRINVSTLGLAVLLAVLVTPVYKDLAEQIRQCAPGWWTWLTWPSIAFLYAVQGGSALASGRLLSKWIFVHEKDGK
ncbi:hypothetical protein [Burkholderia contaminans]|uniref:hypothetical protein n=1 Tax=Burkholderia contaminans TaxID=488447 RepID=UPI002D803F13|nr:hypothetical protein [Burkholderia contaminans]